MNGYQIRITVINCADPSDVFKTNVPLMPDGKPYVRCTAFKEGEVYISVKGNVPDNFCEWAWYDIYKDLQVLRFGGSFYPWVPNGLMYTCCTDGVRPVTFKLEQIIE